MIKGLQPNTLQLVGATFCPCVFIYASAGAIMPGGLCKFYRDGVG